MYHVSCWFFFGSKEFFHTNLYGTPLTDSIVKRCCSSAIFQKSLQLQYIHSGNFQLVAFKISHSLLSDWLCHKWGFTLRETYIRVFDVTSKDIHRLGNIPVTIKIVHDSCVSSWSTRELWTGVANNVPSSPANPHRAQMDHYVSHSCQELMNRWTTHNIRRYRSCFAIEGSSVLPLFVLYFRCR
jgi:hypothetical protein